MNKKRMVALSTLAATAIALTIAPVMARVPSSSAEATQIRMPISFTLTPTQCPKLQVTVMGSGEFFSVINSRVDQNGMVHIEESNLVTGTAVDSDGATYVFNYHAHVALQIPESAFPFTIEGEDHFNLVGNGRANQLHTEFVARGTFTSPTDPPIIEFVNVHGNPFQCDPL
jgi:hypothetical protein